jgi:cell division protein FtsW
MAGGAVMVYSASSARTLLEGTGDGTTYLVKYVMYGAVGLVLLQVMARRGLELVERFAPLMLIVAFALLFAVHLPGIGVEVNGAKRWIGAGPLQFQPSEIMKLALVLYAARMLAGKPQRLRTLKGVISPVLVVAGAAILLIASQPDLGTALVIAFTMGAMLLAAGAPMKHMASLAGIGAGAVMLFALVEPYRRARLTTFLDPWAHASDAGFQSVQGLIALGSGGVFGVGPGQSVQKIFYLPEAHTDFILAVIGEELGVVGICVLLILYGMIAYGGLRAAKAARTPFTQLVAAGVTSLIVSQALLNTFTVLGLAPLTGVPLPFVSAGSTSITVLLASMGLLLNIASGRHSHLRAVPSGSGHGDTDRHRGRGHGGTRRAGSGGRRRAAG